MGRPGLDPGTLGLKEGCGWSEWSGGVGIIRDSAEACPVASDLSGEVGMVRGKLRGIFDAVHSLSVQLYSEPMTQRWESR